MLGRVAGPFSTPTLDNLRLFPAGLVPKKIRTFRLIHQLSYPAGDSVNHFIDHKYCSVKYTSFVHAFEMLSTVGPSTLIACLDRKNAFRLLSVHPWDFQLPGYIILDKIFVDKCLPFGCSLSCDTFENFSTFFKWLLKSQCPVVMSLINWAIFS